MSVSAEPVRLDFDDYVHYAETHLEGAFELLDGAIFKLAPEGDAHLRTRSAIDWMLNRTLDLARYRGPTISFRMGQESWTARSARGPRRLTLLS
jgi:hypothetical protein